MKKIFNWQFFLGLILISLSAIVYYIDFLIFRDARHIFIYLIGDIGFVFFEVFLVTLVIHQLLHYREKKSMLQKLNMVIGAFFVEVGTELIKQLYLFDKKSFDLSKNLIIKIGFTSQDFFKMREFVKGYSYDIDSRLTGMDSLKSFLLEKRQFLLRLLENANLLEHESFTDLLWAVSHLTEELSYRRNLRQLPESDYNHLSGDMKRAYERLILEWLSYMKHLMKDYPYLYSLAVRTNPFDMNASVEVK